MTTSRSGRGVMRTVEEVQQEFANNSCFNDKMIWDLLSESQHTMMTDKIQQLIPDQKRGNARLAEMRKNIFDSVWAQRKYTNGNSVSAIIYVLVANCEDENLALNARVFSCHPVFRTRKCISNDDSSNCCMIFIDELGRVYQNWKTYLLNNELPSGFLVAPRNGIYTNDYMERAQLEVHITPNGSITRRALGYADTATAIAGFSAAAIPLAGMALTITPAIIFGSGVVCATTAAYSAIRSACNLVDRKKHEQSIGLNNSQARNAWLSVGASVVGIGATTASKSIITAAAAGEEISMVTELVANGMNISSIVLSGTGVANGILDVILKYHDDEEISQMDLVQLAASLIIFTHSVTNFQMVSTQVNDRRQITIQEYRKALSRRQRKMFDKMSKETIRIRGANHGKLDLIRIASDMPSKQYLRDQYKITRNSSKLLVGSLATIGLGIIILPNNVAISLSNYGKRIYEFVFNKDQFEDIITMMADTFGEQAFDFLMKLAQEFVEEKLDPLRGILKMFITAESILYRIFVYCLEKCIEHTYEFLLSKKYVIINAICGFFISLNPARYINLQRCNVCEGSYSICQL